MSTAHGDFYLSRLHDNVPFVLHEDPQPVNVATFADDVRTGLLAEHKRLPPKYFYDDLGSALFEAITHLPEYYLTRAERALLEAHADDIVAAMDGPIELVELGSGSATKTRLLIASALQRQRTLRYSPIDISAGALVASSRALVEQYPGLSIEAYAADYVPLLQRRPFHGAERTMALFLGSNVGNFEPNDATALLRALAAALRPGDALLLGTDIKKSIERLEDAYDDPTGATAAFIKNVLGRINRELGGEFDLRTFDHEAHYDPVRGAVDSFLVSQYRQEVRINALGIAVQFAQRESIHAESSYKYSEDDIERLALESGYRVGRRWTDAARDYALSLLFVD